MTEENMWDRLIENVRGFVDSGRLDKEEIAYKREIGRNLAAARDALLAEDGNWLDQIKTVIQAAMSRDPINLIFWRNGRKVIDWFDKNTNEASVALQAVWSADEQGTGARIHSFASRFPDEVIGGAGGPAECDLGPAYGYGPGSIPTLPGDAFFLCVQAHRVSRAIPGRR